MKVRSVIGVLLVLVMLGSVMSPALAVSTKETKEKETTIIK